MAILKLLDQKNKTVTDPVEIKAFLNARGIIFEQWTTEKRLKDDDHQETILEAYQQPLSCYMAKHGYNNADVVNVHKGTPNVEEVRKKFLTEHTHDEDEVRFFVDGQGEFFFHLEKPKSEVFSLLCQKGDFISVPQGYKHWFDLAPGYFVKAIRVFKTKEGWVARYTGSGVEKKYL